MGDRILLVDDEQRILDGYRRNLGRRFEMEFAPGPGEALDMIENGSEFAVVVTDLQMPVMNGIDMLAKIREISPDTVRMMLTGQADLNASIDAVNEGRVFRFLTKPCPADDLGVAITDALEHYHLVRAERELLEGTLHSTVDLLGEVLGLVDQGLQEQSTNLAHLVRTLAAGMGVESAWEYELAAKLSRIGVLTLPDDIRQLVSDREPLDADQESVASRHPAAAHHLLERIPRLEGVAAMVRDQAAPPPGTPPEPNNSERRAAIGSWMLHVAAEYDALRSKGMTTDSAAKVLETRADGESIFEVLVGILRDSPPGIVRWSRKEIAFSELDTSMVIDEPVSSRGGDIMLVPADQPVTIALIERMASIKVGIGIAEPIKVRVPLDA